MLAYLLLLARHPRILVSPRWGSLLGNTTTEGGIPSAVPVNLVLAPNGDHLIPIQVTAGFDLLASSGPIAPAFVA